jgi:hypothetical protein
MEFNNLERNILYDLGFNNRQLDTMTPLKISHIYINFGDIPEENVNKAIINLQNDGLLETSKESRDLFLTSKGIATIEGIYNCLREKSICPQQKTTGCCFLDN